MAIRERVQTHDPVAIPNAMTIPSGSLQRKCACAESSEGGCESCRQKSMALQRHSHKKTVPAVPSLVHDVLRSPGQPLAESTRAYFEPRFGHDFSAIRVHADHRAARSAAAIGAEAYTVGRNVVFGGNRYSPQTSSGRKLIAHELTHAVQQGLSRYSAGTQLKVIPPEHASEQQAEHVAGRSASGRSIANALIPASLGVAREPSPNTQASPETLTETVTGGESAGTQTTGGTGSTGSGGGGAGRPVFFCSKPILGSSLHGQSHAFFRVGGSGAGNTTYELEHDKPCPCAWQGFPRTNDPDDFNASNATCIAAPAISESCLVANWSSYPVGKYCARGPNSNTYTRVIAEKCGAVGLRPPGNVLGFDAAPPVAGTHSAPHPYIQALGWCDEVECGEYCPD